MPESIKQKMNALGKKNKQDKWLKFSNCHNIDFYWSLNNEATTLIKDNVTEHKYPYPGIPSEVPRVLMEEKVPSIKAPHDDPQ